MDTNARGHIRAAFLVLTLTVVGLMTTFIGMNPVGGAVEGLTPRSGCQFQIFLRPPIEFAGPAGGADFELHNRHAHGANIQVTNAYGTKPCSWNATINQNWATLSTDGGTLQADGGTEVTVSINERATQLSRGIHRALITFTSREDPQPGFKKQVEVILYAQKPCDLQIVSGPYRGRSLKGEIPSGIGTATLNNLGDSPCRWSARSDVPWLTVTPVSGVVHPRDPQQITIRANDGVHGLRQDVEYDATILMQWRSTHVEYFEIPASLKIDALPCELYFAEGQRFEVRGKAGAVDSFQPLQNEFPITNLGGRPCDTWNAHHSAPWLRVNDDPTIYSGQNVSVVVGVDTTAAAREWPGEYERVVTFGAGNQSTEHGLSTLLIVEPQPCHLSVSADRLDFRIEPEGLLPGESEKPITISNNWTNAACHWKSESRWDWLSTEPASGVLPNGESQTVTVKIERTDAIVQLDPGTHTAEWGFVVEDGSADEAADVSVRIECKIAEPCGFLHSTHTQVDIREEVKISLALYNPREHNLVAKLLLEVPSGWAIESDAFAERCSSVCNKTSNVPPGGNQDFIELYATPNDAGKFEFVGQVEWEEVATETSAGASEDSQADPEGSDRSIKTTPLRLEVEVRGPPEEAIADAAAVEVAADVAEQITNRIAPTLVSQAQAAVEEAAATQEPDDQSATISQPVDPGQSTTSTDPQVGWQSGVSAQWMILGIAVVVVVFIAAIVAAILIGFRWLANAQRRMPPSESAPGSE